MLDAPVSGGVAGAEQATLTFIVGGAAATVEQARPLLEVMGRKVFHAGAAGAGQVAKICNNMLLAVHMAGTAEALRLGVSAGLDPKVLSDIMRASSGGNWSLEVYNPWPGVLEGAPASRDYQGGFLVDLMVKDLGLAMQAALEEGVSTPMGALARNLYTLLQTQGFGERDFSSIQTLFQGRDDG
jgi:3-hydroxyisobutyrate dehydrogenase and related beta-hydroxyacid dehydrogenases